MANENDGGGGGAGFNGGAPGDPIKFGIPGGEAKQAFNPDAPAGGPALTGDPVVDALNQQNWIAQQGLDQQKAYDKSLTDQASKNEADQEKAYSDQLAMAKDAAAQQTKDNAANLDLAKQTAASNAANMAAQLGLAQATFNMQEQNMNRLNQKAPDIIALSAQNSQQMRTGQGSTMLSGPSGVDTSKMLLGSSAVLGS